MAAPITKVKTSDAFNPYCIQGELRGFNNNNILAWSFTIRPILASDRGQAMDFLWSYDASYLCHESPVGVLTVANKVSGWIDAHLNSDPFSAYLLHDPNGKIAGIWEIGHYGVKKGDLRFKFQLKDEYQRMGIGTALSKWVIRQFLPRLIDEQLVVDETKIHVAVLPDHFLVSKLKKMGFESDEHGIDYQITVKKAMDISKELLQVRKAS